jgi:hypothetical protein
MYILEATPRREIGKASEAIDSRTIIYSDSEVLFPP